MLNHLKVKLNQQKQNKKKGGRIFDGFAARVVVYCILLYSLVGLGVLCGALIGLEWVEWWERVRGAGIFWTPLSLTQVTIGGFPLLLFRWAGGNCE